MITRPTIHPGSVLTMYDLADAIAPFVQRIRETSIRIAERTPDGRNTDTDASYWRVRPCVVEAEIAESDLLFVLDECRVILGETQYTDALIPWRAELEPCWAVNGERAFVRYQIGDQW